MRYYIWALGCAMNKSDAERIASVFQGAGFTETEKESDADVIVTVACSVRQHAIDRIYGKARSWQRVKKERPLATILSGCVLERDKKKLAQTFDLIFEIGDLQKLKQFLRKNSKSEIRISKQYQNQNGKNMKADVLNFENWDLFRNSRLPARPKPSEGGEIENYEDYFHINPKRESLFMAYVPISTGCDNFCTYCAVPYTRGREVSRPMNEILAEVRELVSDGYKEITLLGQNVNSYGRELSNRTTEQQNNGTRQTGEEKQVIAKQGQSLLSHFARTVLVNNTQFVQLLKQIDKIPGDYRVYFYSNHPKDMSDELVETLPKLRHFPRYIHLPLQSGSNRIIKAMNRHHTREKYLDLVEKIKKAMPDVTLTTDIIVGFPGETDKDFEETKKVVESVGFSMAYIAKYSPRPGTVAAKVADSVPQEEKEKRWQALTKIQEKILEKENKKLVGKHLRVLVDSEKKGKYYGRTDSYKVTEIDPKSISVILSERERVEGSLKKVGHLNMSDLSKQNIMGQFVEVKVTDSTAWMLKGELLSS